MVQPWMRGVLLIGAFYNAAWSIFLFYKPNSYIKWMTENTQQQNDLVFYQAIGVAVVGIMMFMSMLKPLQYKWMIAIVFLAKLVGGLFGYFLLMQGQFTKKFMFHLLMNDLVWLFPLAAILVAVYSNKKSDNR